MRGRAESEISGLFFLWVYQFFFLIILLGGGEENDGLIWVSDLVFLSFSICGLLSNRT